MSNKRVTTNLRGWNGPFFTAETVRLQKLTRTPEVLDPGTIRECVGPTFKPTITPAARTNDGYLWASAVILTLGDRQALYLLPHCTDQMQEGGTMADRHVALYLAVGTPVRSAAFMSSFIDRLEELPQYVAYLDSLKGKEPSFLRRFLSRFRGRK